MYLGICHRPTSRLVMPPAATDGLGGDTNKCAFAVLMLIITITAPEAVGWLRQLGIAVVDILVCVR
jgi:hypothetical protein